MLVVYTFEIECLIYNPKIKWEKIPENTIQGKCTYLIFTNKKTREKEMGLDTQLYKFYILIKPQADLTIINWESEIGTSQFQERSRIQIASIEKLPE